MTMNMIEKVSSALRDEFKAKFELMTGLPFGDTGVLIPASEVWEGYARAAIEAMKEPTAAMMADGVIQDATIDKYRAMISAALKE
jgi:hypothetical protein